MDTMDLNADLGEGGCWDQHLLKWVTSANIACGGHAGNRDTMREAVARCLATGVAVGAHPGYEDREHFGRRPHELDSPAVGKLMRRQLGEFMQIVTESGATLHHVKPHGALYHQADRNRGHAEEVACAVNQVCGPVILYGMPGGELERAAAAAGLRFCPEGFVERRYQADGSLVPRGEVGAVILDVGEAVSQAIALWKEGRIRTLCVHGDGDSALAMLVAVREALEAAGGRVGAP